MRWRSAGRCRLWRKTALLDVAEVFVVGQVLGAVAQGCGTMVVTRLVTAVAAAAFFGVAPTASVELVGEGFGWRV